VENEFQSFVKPEKHPYLTGFCIGLTGITQEIVDNAPKFLDVLNSFEQWMEKNNLIKDGEILESSSFSLVTWSNSDIQAMLASQCKREKIKLPSYFHKWIDLRDCFEKRYQADGNRTVNRDGLRGAFRELGLNWTGRLHSGIDDARNTVKVVQRMIKDNWLFEHTDHVFTRNLMESGQELAAKV